MVAKKKIEKKRKKITYNKPKFSKWLTINYIYLNINDKYQRCSLVYANERNVPVNTERQKWNIQ